MLAGEDVKSEFGVHIIYCCTFHYIIPFIGVFSFCFNMSSPYKLSSVGIVYVVVYLLLLTTQFVHYPLAHAFSFIHCQTLNMLNYMYFT